MDNDSLHFQKQLDEYEENIWYSKKHFDQYQEFRDQIRPIWDDSASKDVNNRYLEPNQEDSLIFLDNTQLQYTELQKVLKQVQEIGVRFEKANIISSGIDEIFLLIDQDMADAAMSQEASLDVFQKTEATLEEALLLIRKVQNS